MAAKPRLRRAQTAALLLERYWVREFVYRELSTGEPSVPLDIRLAGPDVVADSDTSAEVSLRISASDGTRVVDLTLVGLFIIPNDSPRFLVLNAPSILFGIARGLVSNVTALTNAGRLDLPSINIAEFVQKR